MQKSRKENTCLTKSNYLNKLLCKKINMVDRQLPDEMGLHGDGDSAYTPPTEDKLEVHYESHPEYFETLVNTFLHKNPDGTVNVAETNRGRRNILDGLVDGCIAPLITEYGSVVYRRTENLDGNGLLAIKYFSRRPIL